MPEILKPELTVEEVSEWVGVKEVTVRRMIRDKKMPFTRRYVNHHVEVRIPSLEFMIWFEREVKRYEDKLERLKRGQKRAEIIVYGSTGNVVHGK